MATSLYADDILQGAEAYISFGNVSNPAVNEQYYQRALRYLDRASRTEGFILEAHFRQYVHILPRHL